MPSSAFRPRLPIDPFSTAHVLAPWHVPQDLPYSQPQVILILGEAQKNDLLCLLTSPHLTGSVLLIATHVPPPIPALPQSTPGPDVRVLRLSHPLAIHDNGALRLVNLFEKAHRVSGRWRKSTPGEHRFVQLAECRHTGEFTVVEPLMFVDGHGKPAQSYPSPSPSVLSQPRKFRLSSLSLLSSKASESTTSLPTTSQGGIQRKKLRRKTTTLDQAPPFSLAPGEQGDGFRAFDALLNFLPSSVPDKALLKHAILVTTLSAQYLSTPNGGPIAGGDESSLNHGSTTNPSPRSSAPSSGSSRSPLTSIATTPATSPSPSPPLLPPSQEPSNNSNPDAPRRRNTIRASFGKHFSSFLRPPPPSSSANSASAVGTQYANGRVDTRVNGSGDGYGYAKPKNAHLVHILPRGWEEQRGEEGLDDDDDRQQQRLGQSSRAPGTLQHVNNTPSSSKQPSSGTSRLSSKPKLAQGMEQFLLSFAYPLGSLRSEPRGVDSSRPGVCSSTRSEQGHGGDRKPALTGLAAAAVHAQTRPVPYLLAPGVFESVLDGSREGYPGQGEGYDHLEEHYLGRAGGTRTLSIGEVILLGALDFDPEEAYSQKTDAHTHSSRHGVEDRGNARAVGGGRAWVGIGDVVHSRSKREEGKEKEREREERVVDKEERDRRIRETERRLEGSSSMSMSIPRRTSTDQTKTMSTPGAAVAGTSKATQSLLQLPTPPGSSSSSAEEHDPQHRYRAPAAPQRVYALALPEHQERGRRKDSTRTPRTRRGSGSVSASTSQRGDKLGSGVNPTPAPRSSSLSATHQGSARSSSKPTITSSSAKQEDPSTSTPNSGTNPTPAPTSKWSSSLSATHQGSAHQGSARSSSKPTITPSSSSNLKQEDPSSMTSALNGPPPPTTPSRPARNHMRPPGAPIAPSAALSSPLEIPRVEGIPLAVYSNSKGVESSERRRTGTRTRRTSSSGPPSASAGTSTTSDLSSPGAARQKSGSGSRTTDRVPVMVDASTPLSQAPPPSRSSVKSPPATAPAPSRHESKDAKSSIQGNPVTTSTPEATTTTTIPAALARHEREHEREHIGRPLRLPATRPPRASPSNSRSRLTAVGANANHVQISRPYNGVVVWERKDIWEESRAKKARGASGEESEIGLGFGRALSKLGLWRRGSRRS